MPDIPLLLVDGHNLLFRACFGTPAQIFSRDKEDKRDLTTEFMFFALLRKGINEELPGWPEVVVVFDGEDGSAQRKQADAGYKANRPVGGEALKPIRALPAVKAGLDLFGVRWVEVSDAEADDVIATLAASCHHWSADSAASAAASSAAANARASAGVMFITASPSCRRTQRPTPEGSGTSVRRGTHASGYTQNAVSARRHSRPRPR